MLKIALPLLILFSAQQICADENSRPFEPEKLVVATKRIFLPEYPNAWNPSIIQVDSQYLLTFRYCPAPNNESFTSYIGIVVLNDQFEPVSTPQLLNTRNKNSKIPSQSEDARIFQYRDRLFLIYNDNADIVLTSIYERRDMFIAELFYTNEVFSLGNPVKLVYEAKYNSQVVQKNWVPFVKDEALLLTYTLNPHEVLYPNLKTGLCYPSYISSADIKWNFGSLRGSTPPLLVDGQYLAFFHSADFTSSPSSLSYDLWHYFMGAYTFSIEPPFEVTQITPLPITSEGFYTHSDYYKRVIFPGGFVLSDSYIYVAYGKDDRELWIATLDKEMLRKALRPVETISVP